MSFEGFGDWKGTTYYICKNQPLGLWVGIHDLQWRVLNDAGLPWSERKPYPYELVECSCDTCKDEIAFRLAYVKGET